MLVQQYRVFLLFEKLGLEKRRRPGRRRNLQPLRYLTTIAEGSQIVPVAFFSSPVYSKTKFHVRLVIERARLSNDRSISTRQIFPTTHLSASLVP